MFTDYEWMASTQIMYIVLFPVFAVGYFIAKRKRK